MRRIIPRSLFAALVLFFCGTALLAVAQKKDTPKVDPDEAALAEAKELGYDLSTPHMLYFHLVIAQECEDEVVSRLQEAGFDVWVWPKGKVRTKLDVHKTMVPELSALRKIRGDLGSLVKSPCHPGAAPGSYIGWNFDPNSDEAYLAGAKKAGYDLSKPYKLWFRLIAPPGPCEKQVDSRLRQAGFEVELWPKGTVGTIVIARKTMVPDLAALHKIRQDVKSLGTSACDPRDPPDLVSWGIVTDHFDGMVIK